MRKRLVVGNWKMNGNKLWVSNLVATLIEELDAELCKEVDVVICPPFIYIPESAYLIKDTNIQLGAQNAYSEPNGAFTGEISPNMLAEFSCGYVIIGHSERRKLLAESDALIAKKLQTVLAAGMKPILCVGETRAERDAGMAFEVIKRQLMSVLETTSVNNMSNVIIAYEPVWAIGTGLTATPEVAEEAHRLIRDEIAMFDESIANEIRIVYGGSVNESNAAQLFSQPNIDGGLIGGASLKAQEFIAICNKALSTVE